MTLVKKLFSFRGRLRRRDWWLWSIAILVFQVLMTEIVALLIFGRTHSLLGGTGQAAPQRATDAGAQTVLAISALVFLWPWLALTVKRAHDRDSKGLLVVICMLVASVRIPPAFYADIGAPVSALLGTWATTVITSLALIALQIFLIVTLGFLDGTKGPNRFGPSPKGIGGTGPEQSAEVFS